MVFVAEPVKLVLFASLLLSIIFDKLDEMDELELKEELLEVDCDMGPLFFLSRMCK